MNSAALPWPQWLFYVSARWGWRTLFHLTGGFHVDGLENVPFRGPVIIAPNHHSLADPWIACAAIPNILRSVAADDLFSVRGLGWYLRAMGAFPVRRGSPDPASLGTARGFLADGATLMIFPEGGISPEGQPRPWQPGVALLSLRTGVPVVPTVIHGSGRLLPVGSYIPRRRPVRVRFLPAVVPPELNGAARVKQQVDAFRTLLQDTWAEGYRVLSGQEEGSSEAQETWRNVQ